MEAGGLNEGSIPQYDNLCWHPFWRWLFSSSVESWSRERPQFYVTGRISQSRKDYVNVFKDQDLKKCFTQNKILVLDNHLYNLYDWRKIIIRSVTRRVTLISFRREICSNPIKEYVWYFCSHVFWTKMHGLQR